MVLETHILYLVVSMQYFPPELCHLTPRIVVSFCLSRDLGYYFLEFPWGSDHYVSVGIGVFGVRYQIRIVRWSRIVHLVDNSVFVSTA